MFHARTKDHPKDALREGHSRDCPCDVCRSHLANHGQVEGQDRRGRCFEVSRTLLLNSSTSARERYLQMALSALPRDGTRVSRKKPQRLSARLHFNSGALLRWQSKQAVDPRGSRSPGTPQVSGLPRQCPLPVLLLIYAENERRDRRAGILSQSFSQRAALHNRMHQAHKQHTML